MKKCEDSCTYSKSMNQPYPRICIHCGNLEEIQPAIDLDKITISRTQETDLNILANLLRHIEQRNVIIQNKREIELDNYIYLIDSINSKIKQILNIP